MLANIFENLTQTSFYIALGITLFIYFVLLIIRNVIMRKLKKISATTETFVDDLVLVALEKTRQFFILGLALYGGFYSLHLKGGYAKTIYKLFVVIISIQVIIWGRVVIEEWVKHTVEKKSDDPSIKTSMGFISLILKTFFIVSVVLFALNNLGVNVSTFVAGLGVGGIAIALATQNILGDLLSSLSIVMDKPFVVGDFVSLGEWSGTIEHIGLKTTRLRSLTGEQIVISNSDLLSSKIRNFKRMRERRIVFEVGVTYQTKREDLKRAPKIIEEIIVNESLARFDRSHFIRYGNSSLDIETVYWVNSADYNVFAQVHERILFAIHEAFEKNNLDFAYPTQTLFIESSKGPSV